MSKLGFGDSSADRDTAASASKDKVPSTWEQRESPADRWADELADWIAKRLCHIVDRQGQALLYVSGGSSPVPVFKRLSQLAVPWAQVTITLVDERVVPDAHPASNARLVQEHLLVGNAQWARWVPWIQDLRSNGDPALECMAQAEHIERSLQRLGRADLMLLGMGEDGHIASLFPRSQGLSEALSLDQKRMCVPVLLDSLPPQAPFHRISVTLAHILRSRQLVLAASGQAKKALLAEALNSPDLLYPVSSVLHQSSTPLLVWTTT